MDREKHLLERSLKMCLEREILGLLEYLARVIRHVIPTRRMVLSQHLLTLNFLREPGRLYP